MKILHFQVHSPVLSSILFFLFFNNTLLHIDIQRKCSKKNYRNCKKTTKIIKNNNKHILHITQYTQIYCLYSTSRLVVIHMYKGKG